MWFYIDRNGYAGGRWGVVDIASHAFLGVVISGRLLGGVMDEVQVVGFR